MGICTGCDLARMSIGEKPKCTKSKKGVTECEDFISHKCRTCENMTSCGYIKSMPKAPGKYKFIKKVCHSERSIIIVECANYKFIDDKPRGNPKKAAAFCADFFDAIKESQRKNY